jgi:ATP-dependent Clp protease ATP-binding subunit ClpA
MSSEILPSQIVRDAFRVLPEIVNELGHDSGDTGHVLLAMVRIAPEAFARRCDPLTLERALLRLMPSVEQVGGESSRGEVPVAPPLVEVLQLCQADVHRTGATELSLDHVVSGIIQLSDGVAAAALREVGVESLEDWGTA